MPTPGPVSWHVELTVKPGALEAFRTLTAEMVAVARGEAGVLAYERFISADGTRVHVYERWADSQAAQAHLEAFAARFAERYAALVERQRFLVYGEPSDALQALLRRFGASEFLGLMDGFAEP